MQLFGLQISRAKPAGEMVAKSQTMESVRTYGGWFGVIRESFAGAFQRNIEIDSPRDILAFSAVFSSTTRIATDIAKLGAGLMQDDGNGILLPLTELGTHGNAQSMRVLRLLRAPNQYQTWFKFIEQWVVSKLLHGNTYVFKERDESRSVIALYVLDAQRVTPMVADDGSIWYQLSRDYLSSIGAPIRVPASEIIHDTMVSLWHPLVGVSPIYACGLAATLGNRIQANGTRFFANMSRPSGFISSPNLIADDKAEELKRRWEQNYSGAGMGRTAVLGGGLTYVPMMMNAVDSEIIRQLQMSVEDVARAYHIPMYKLGGPEPPRVSVESLEQTYYNDCLHGPIESQEALLRVGLELPLGQYIKFNLRNLMRMDSAARYKALGDGVRGMWLSPNEARASENLPPVKGGNTPLAQQQNYSLEALGKRDASADPFAAGKGAGTTSTTTGDGAPETDAAAQAASMAEIYIKGLSEHEYA